MKLDELTPVLTSIKDGIATIAESLADVAANQTEATTEILDALANLRNLDIPEAAVTLLTDIQNSLNSVVTETGVVSSQAKTLADIIT